MRRRLGPFGRGYTIFCNWSPAPEEEEENELDNTFGTMVEEDEEVIAPITKELPLTGANVKSMADQGANAWGVTAAVVQAAVKIGKVRRPSKFDVKEEEEGPTEFVRKSSVKQGMQQISSHEFKLEKALRKRDADVDVKVVVPKNRKY